MRYFLVGTSLRLHTKRSLESAKSQWAEPDIKHVRVGKILPQKDPLCYVARVKGYWLCGAPSRKAFLSSVQPPKTSKSRAGINVAIGAFCARHSKMGFKPWQFEILGVYQTR